MARYFFHVRDGSDLVRDAEGIELSGVSGITTEILLAAREVLAEDEWIDELTADRFFEIVDEAGKLVLVVPFVEVTAMA
jgi:Domain of unknown function (DUF6894)